MHNWNLHFFLLIKFWNFCWNFQYNPNENTFLAFCTRGALGTRNTIPYWGGRTSISRLNTTTPSLTKGGTGEWFGHGWIEAWGGTWLCPLLWLSWVLAGTFLVRGQWTRTKDTTTYENSYIAHSQPFMQTNLLTAPQVVFTQVVTLIDEKADVTRQTLVIKRRQARCKHRACKVKSTMAYRQRQGSVCCGPSS